MKSKKDDHSLYFIALVPEEPLQSELMELKEWIYTETGSKGALRSPAHITLHMPFKWKEIKEEGLIKSLDKLAFSISNFNVSLKNYSCFEPRVIYVGVENNKQLIDLRNEVMSLSRKEWKLDLPKDLRGFNPHITIGFRDLKKPQFNKAWDQLKEKSFSSSFNAFSITLLKHNGKKWDVHKKFELN